MVRLSTPTFADVLAAERRLSAEVRHTPVISGTALDGQLGARVFCKCENFQRMGAFKFRGAYNALARLDPAQRARGVIAFSSGNHAQAIALAARLLGLRATIVMPRDAPEAKLEATRDYGGTVVLYDRFTEDREQITRQLAAERGLTVIPPFDHPDVIAGQGTAAKELFDEVGPLDRLYVCLGGGGLLAGSALAARAMSPGCAVVGVEPLAGNDGQRSLRGGEVVRIDVPQTIADGAQTQSLGRYTFEIIRRDVADIVTVTDAELIDSMDFCARQLKMIVEPTGCLALAAVRAAGAQLAGMRVGLIISGGNVDMERFAELLGEARPRH